jgi:hypothetical protein
MLGNFIKLNIIKKIIGIYNARVSAWRPPSYLDKAYMVIIHDGAWSDTIFFMMVWRMFMVKIWFGFR